MSMLSLRPSYGIAAMMRPVLLTAPSLPIAVSGWVDAGDRVCFSDEQVALVAKAMTTERPVLERRLSGGWLQRSGGWEPHRVPSFTAAGEEFFQLDGNFKVVDLQTAATVTPPAAHL